MKFLLVTRFITGCSEAFGTPPRVCSFLSIFAKTVQPRTLQTQTTGPRSSCLGSKASGCSFFISFNESTSRSRSPESTSLQKYCDGPGPCPPSSRSFSKSVLGHHLCAKPFCSCLESFGRRSACNPGTVLTFGLPERRVGLIRNWPKFDVSGMSCEPTESKRRSSCPVHHQCWLPREASSGECEERLKPAVSSELRHRHLDKLFPSLQRWKPSEEGRKNAFAQQAKLNVQDAVPAGGIPSCGSGSSTCTSAGAPVTFKHRSPADQVALGSRLMSSH